MEKILRINLSNNQILTENALDEDFYNSWRLFLRQEWTSHQEWIIYLRERPEDYGFAAFCLNLFGSLGEAVKSGFIDADSFFSIYSE